MQDPRPCDVTVSLDSRKSCHTRKAVKSQLASFDVNTEQNQHELNGVVADVTTEHCQGLQHSLGLTERQHLSCTARLVPSGAAATTTSSTPDTSTVNAAAAAAATEQICHCPSVLTRGALMPGSSW